MKDLNDKTIVFLGSKFIIDIILVHNIIYISMIVK
jgi:hypothetical protein